MERDWEARFYPERERYSKPGALTGLALPIIVVFVLWAILVFSIGFEDSMGRPRNSDLLGHVRGYSIALLPLLIPAFLIYKDWKAKRTVAAKRLRDLSSPVRNPMSYHGWSFPRRSPGASRLDMDFYWAGHISGRLGSDQPSRSDIRAKNPPELRLDSFRQPHD
jgi:hypothetical protein